MLNRIQEVVNTITPRKVQVFLNKLDQEVNPITMFAIGFASTYVIGKVIICVINKGEK